MKITGRTIAFSVFSFQFIAGAITLLCWVQDGRGNVVFDALLLFTALPVALAFGKGWDWANAEEAKKP